MARTSTLAVLRLAVQEHGQYENSADITTVMLNRFINEAIAECYDLLVQRWADYYVTRANVLFVVGTDLYTLPTDFYKLRKVEIADASASSGWRQLFPVDLSVSHQYGVASSIEEYRYRLEQGSVVIVPTPATAETIRLFYVPSAAMLTLDTDAFDGINGYEELVLQLAMKRCKAREELPTNDIDEEVARLTQRIRSAADGRDATEPLSYNPRGNRRTSTWSW